MHQLWHNLGNCRPRQVFIVIGSCKHIFAFFWCCPAVQNIYFHCLFYKLNIPIFVCLLCCMEEGQWWRHCSDREDLSSVSSGRDQHLLLNSAAHCPVSFKVFKVCTEICAHSSFTCGLHQSLHTAEITTILPLHNCKKNLKNYKKSGSGKYQKPSIHKSHILK